MTTQLLIFASSNLHRAAWQVLLRSQPGITVQGAVGKLGQIADFRSPSPAAVLIDVPTVQPESVSKLHTAIPGCELLFFVQSYNLNEIVGLLRAGAIGVIVRDSTVGDLARAIIAAGRGEIVLPQEQATKAQVALARGEVFQDMSSDALIEREREVLNFLARGHPIVSERCD